MQGSEGITILNKSASSPTPAICFCTIPYLQCDQHIVRLIPCVQLSSLVMPRLLTLQEWNGMIGAFTFLAKYWQWYIARLATSTQAARFEVQNKTRTNINYPNRAEPPNYAWFRVVWVVWSLTLT